MLDFLGKAVGGALSFFGAQDQNKVAQQNAQRNIDLQREFAQSGIQWKVNDAREAGIHPLYALGASTHSFAPVSVGSVNQMAGPASAMASMGQDITRSINATRTGQQRVDAFTQTAQALQLENSGLQNQLLSAQIAKLRASPNPAFPSNPVPPIPEATKFDARPLLEFGGRKISTDPYTSNMQEYENRYGDEGIASWIIPPWIMYQDFLANQGQPTVNSLPMRMWDKMVNMESSPQAEMYKAWKHYKGSWK